jgi:hypothetical protein
VSDQPADGHAPAPGERPALLVAAVVLAVLEAVAIAVYAVSIAVAALHAPGSVSSAPVVVVFLAFAGGVLLCARGLWLRRRAARTPFGVIQLFGLVTGWTLTQGDGDLVQWIGRLVLAVSVVGIALVLSPAVGQSLEL